MNGGHLTSRAFARLAKLPPAQQRDVAIDRDQLVAMTDGVVLLADRWYPTNGASQLPVVLVRTPYGRAQMGTIARLFAERGYQVVVQSCRGTFGSGGVWDPFRNERRDGHDTLDWLQRQPWFAGHILTFGPSYLGLTQWSVLDDPPASLRAVALDVTAANFRDAVVFPGGSFSLDTGATWLHLLEHQEQGPWTVLRNQLSSRRLLAPVFRTLPLQEADTVTFGHPVAYYQDWLDHETLGDTWWDAVDFARALERVPPATMVGGWYDLFLRSQVADFQALRAAGRPARLTVGPWIHSSPRGLMAQVADALDWYGRQVGSAVQPDRAPVRLWVMGERRWVDFADWPPPGEPQRWYLQPDGGLGPVPPVAGSPRAFRYDPADPTPSVGGPSLNILTAGRRHQAIRERRSDVLVYTSDVLTADLTVAGPVRAEVWFRSDCSNTDVFVRLCDVSGQGRSVNLCDGLVRLGAGRLPEDEDGVQLVTVELWPTAATFRRGHRIRLQISSAAHPLYARNTNSGEPLGTATTLKVANQQVFSDPAHPSAIELPFVHI